MTITAERAEDWARDGFVVVRALVRESLVDDLVREFEADILPSRGALLRQPRFAREVGPRAFPHAYLAEHELTPAGHMRQGLKDPHALDSHPSVAGLCLRLLCGPETQAALASLDARHPAYAMYQSMLFDANPGTEPHQDSYYIDSEPRGALVGIWVALEDIDARAGRFFVVRGSHLGHRADLTLSNADYLSGIAERFPESAGAIVTPALAKGDAIFWHGDLLHGAHGVSDARFSRKSVTAHYVPSSMLGRGNARVFSNRIMRSAMGMPFAVTTKPDVAARAVVAEEINTVSINGRPIRFHCIETADGERTVTVDPEQERAHRLRT